MLDKPAPRPYALSGEPYLAKDGAARETVMREVIVAAAQLACTPDRDQNVARAEALVREAAARGAKLVLLPELFEAPYFCIEQNLAHFALARPFEGHPLLARMSRLAAELDVVLPVSFFERANNAFFNSVAVIDADGTVLGVYRNSHIPNGSAHQQKFYFTPGDTGFKVWRTQAGVVGVGLSWDQWFPECARSMAIMGAEFLLYPTAIGPEGSQTCGSRSDHWQAVMQGHAAANLVPIVTANRIGREVAGEAAIEFFGSSFVTDACGSLLGRAAVDEEGLVLQRFDLDRLAADRAGLGLFRDRRPDLYLSVLSLDGREQSY